MIASGYVRFGFVISLDLHICQLRPRTGGQKQHGEQKKDGSVVKSLHDPKVHAEIHDVMQRSVTGRDLLK